MMTRRKLMQAVSVLVQTAVIVARYLDFFVVAPWLSCRPLSELLPRELALAPPGSGCCNNEHGAISFSTHGTIAQEPLHFALYAGAFLLMWAWLLWAYFRPPKFWGRRNQGPDGAA